MSKILEDHYNKSETGYKKYFPIVKNWINNECTYIVKFQS